MTDNENAPSRTPRHAVILCHPDPHSFNRGVADAYCAAVRKCGQDVVVRDLYAMGFDPVLKGHERPTGADFTPSPDVRRELDLLRPCDVFVLVYPIWFGTPPAMLKGYVERVLGAGVDPKSVRARAGTSFLAGKRLLSFTSSAASAPWLNEQGQWESLRYLFDHYLKHAFGMQSDDHVHFANVTAGMAPRWVAEHYYEVGRKAEVTCAALAATRHDTASRAA